MAVHTRGPHASRNHWTITRRKVGLQLAAGLLATIRRAGQPLKPLKPLKSVVRLAADPKAHPTTAANAKLALAILQAAGTTAPTA